MEGASVSPGGRRSAAMWELFPIVFEDARFGCNFINRWAFEALTSEAMQWNHGSCCGRSMGLFRWFSTLTDVQLYQPADPPVEW